MAAFFLAVSALVCQVSAQVYNGPILTQPLLQTFQPSPVSQICFPISNDYLPTITQIPTNVPDLRLPLSAFSIENSLLPTITQFPSEVPDLLLPLTSSFVTNPTPVISTTVEDNCLSNSLANVLQLLILSNLLESSNKPAPVSPFFVPFYDAVGTIGTGFSPFDVFSPIANVAPVSNNPVVDVSTVVTDVITSPVSSVYTSVVDVVDIQAPVASYTTYAPIAEVVSPVVIAPAPIPEVITPVISTVSEITSSISQTSTADVYTSITDVNSISVTPIASPTYYYGAQSAPTYVTEITDIVAPISFTPSTPISYISDYYSGYADVTTPVPLTMPFAAELILPQSIPAQIVCNFGYSPVNAPVFSSYVEALPPTGGYFY